MVSGAALLPGDLKLGRLFLAKTVIVACPVYHPIESVRMVFSRLLFRPDLHLSKTSGNKKIPVLSMQLTFRGKELSYLPSCLSQVYI